ncbi:hypothetical protein SAPIO_CDS1671 [Scedosporium apiospermum]|uniref:DUF8021 domain-containing protein n=1 Tax=Pseudallescheria apiosperma TaxID=563466 RepID=A0A084GET4_PSEDA|nr:uncharacterized protein SAPIO_CDS1671 [Scedosporium apiospermum]KEZ45846.1 hypothetical protein SAPIO_CDS1671 [Scedosporium apiospermum]
MIATTTGGWLFNASKILEYINRERWDPIAAEERDSRKALKLEGSAYTAKGEPTDSCLVGIPRRDQPPVSGRRHIIDGAAGWINVLCAFETMRSAPDSHEFRLENGRLRYVHTMTVMQDLDAGVDEE